MNTLTESRTNGTITGKWIERLKKTSPYPVAHSVKQKNFKKRGGVGTVCAGCSMCAKCLRPGEEKKAKKVKKKLDRKRQLH